MPFHVFTDDFQSENFVYKIHGEVLIQNSHLLGLSVFPNVNNRLVQIFEIVESVHYSYMRVYEFFSKC